MSGQFNHAVARRPGPDFHLGITTSGLGKPDFDLVVRQHRAYLEVLKSLELEVVVLDPLPGHPDAYFVEDVAVVTPEVAVLTRPGATARRGEAEPMEPVLARYREIAHIEPPGTVDGGDVLMDGSRFFIGVSGRTNREGCEQLGRILRQHGNTWTPIPVKDGLHLKSAVNLVGHRLLLTRPFADRKEFSKYEKIVLDPGEDYAANTLEINNNLLTPHGFPRTLDKLQRTGLRVIELDVSEVRKMDGGLTCMSLRF